jgi:hypothetical protein
MEVASIVASIATAISALLLAWQVWVARHALKAQTRANELQAYTALNLQFLELIKSFGERVNDPNAREADLGSDERRALDNWFYLANIEFILLKEKAISDALGQQWLRGIRSASKRRIFQERWQSTASKFSLDEDFRALFESAVSPSRAIEPVPNE